VVRTSSCLPTSPGVGSTAFMAANRRGQLFSTWIRVCQPDLSDQEGTAYNGHFACTCYHPLSVFNQFGDLERSGFVPASFIRRTVGRRWLSWSWPATEVSSNAATSAPMRSGCLPIRFSKRRSGYQAQSWKKARRSGGRVALG
jgi:hypothetical protein